jgi:sterol desaturase/sphingolipid hydroxylase (fatty acid hydroxylase superfamily)
MTASALPVTRSQHLYTPMIVLAAATAWLAWFGAATLDHASQLGRAWSTAVVELAGPLVIGFLVIVLVCERLWPAVRRPALAPGHVQDALYFVVFATAIVPLLTFLGVGAASLVHAIAIPGSATWPRQLAVPLALVGMDACNWLAHFAQHRVGLLWRTHAVHHSQEELSVLTTFRTHPLVHMVSFVAATLPVMAITATHPLAPVLITGYLCLGALPHANVNWTFGWFGKVVVSPAYHRIHHAVDGPYDVNLGIVLPWWDMLAGRAIWPSEHPRGATPTGLAGWAIPDTGHPGRVLIQQLAEPFSR